MGPLLGGKKNAFHEVGVLLKARPITYADIWYLIRRSPFRIPQLEIYAIRVPMFRPRKYFCGATRGCS